MKQVLTGLLILTLTVATNASTASASVKPGATCKKVGQSTISSGSKYKCIKSGSKLIWSKGIAVKKSTPAQKPTTAFVPKVITAKDFDELYQNREHIPYTAWKLTADEIARGKSNLKNVTVFIGPKSQEPGYKTPEIAYSLVSRAFSSYKTPDDVYLIQYSIEDMGWAEEKIKSIVDANAYKELDRNENGRLVTSNCSNDCFGAKQVTANNGVAFILQGVPKTKNGDPMGEARWTLGQLDAHEFFHAMQRAHSTPAGTQIKEWPPSWIIEGGASLVQNLAMSHASYDEYMKWRKLDAKNISGSNSVVNQAFVDRFLDVQGNKDYWRGVDNYYSYNLGSRIMEVLVAFKGPAILLDLHKQTTVLGFEDGFKSLFGVEWSKAYPIIGKIAVELLRSE